MYTLRVAAVLSIQLGGARLAKDQAPQIEPPSLLWRGFRLSSPLSLLGLKIGLLAYATTLRAGIEAVRLRDTETRL